MENEIGITPFGETPDGKRVSLFRLKNESGVEVYIMDYGATIVKWMVPDKNGKNADICLGFDSLKGYLKPENPCFGCIVGRYANRISEGRFTLDEKTYELALNNGKHHLHGGEKGFDKVVWDSSTLESENGVRFSYLSVDGEESYPGNLNVSVIYRLRPDDTLEISYAAQTDAPTHLNLTNHAYFNLSGHGRIEDHRLTIHADRITAVDDESIPTGEFINVEGTPFDFRKSIPIGHNLKKTGTEPAGFDHNYVFGERGGPDPQFVAEVFDPASGRRMTVHTTEPGMQLYTANYLDGTLRGKGGQVYEQHSGFCLETQHFPDSPNRPDFPSTILRPGETFRSVTRYWVGV